MKLSELAAKYGTDKLEHGYIPYYEVHLPKKVEKLLEIGAFHGASLKMWKDYFPKAEVSTMDLFGEFPETKTDLESIGVTCYQGDQHDTNFLFNITDKFDLIIDDGSHQPGNQQKTFYHMFVLNLKMKGLFILEDIHTSLDKGWWINDIDKFEDSSLHFLESWVSGNVVPTKILGDHEISILKQNISKIKIYDRKIAFIWKK